MVRLLAVTMDQLETFKHLSVRHVGKQNRESGIYCMGLLGLDGIMLLKYFLRTLYIVSAQ